MITEDRNLIDYYHYWKTEAIQADMRERSHNFSVLLRNTHHDFNIGTAIRNANAFLAREVIILGRRKFDKRGAVGTYNYLEFKHVRAVHDLYVGDSVLVGIDNIPRAVPVETFEWPQDRHVIMAFGQEQIGLDEDILRICDHVVYIQQYGSCRSLNVGTASGIIMYDYCSKLNTPHMHQDPQECDNQSVEAQIDTQDHET